MKTSFVAVVILLVVGAASAQALGDDVFIVTAYELTTPGTTSLLERTAIGNTFVVRASQWTQIAAPLHLPDGAYVTAISLESCNATPTSIFVTVAVRCFPPTQVCDAPPQGGVSTSQPGVCTTTVGYLSAGPVDNRGKTYWISGHIGSVPDDAISTIRVYYRRNVTPVTAFPEFFDDVPETHPFYQFIQALAAANITAGCGYRTYCPNAFVTRGQLAVLLSKALGLYTFP